FLGTGNLPGAIEANSHLDDQVEVDERAHKYAAGMQQSALAVQKDALAELRSDTMTMKAIGVQIGSVQGKMTRDMHAATQDAIKTFEVPLNQLAKSDRAAADALRANIAAHGSEVSDWYKESNIALEQQQKGINSFNAGTGAYNAATKRAMLPIAQQNANAHTSIANTLAGKETRTAAAEPVSQLSSLIGNLGRAGMDPAERKTTIEAAQKLLEQLKATPGAASAAAPKPAADDTEYRKMAEQIMHDELNRQASMKTARERAEAAVNKRLQQEGRKATFTMSEGLKLAQR
ncbi:MAG: hypothetical protein ACRD3W_27065, partial [Terriglobales bacterium]